MTENERKSVIQDTKRMSYSLVAERHNLTRNQVAGLVWRQKTKAAHMWPRLSWGWRVPAHDPDEYSLKKLSTEYRNNRWIAGAGEYLGMATVSIIDTVALWVIAYQLLRHM